MKRISNVLAFAGLLLAGAAQAVGEEPLPVVKLSPQVRTDQARGQSYFENLDCLAAAKETPKSADEAHWLNLRKQKCAARWKAYTQ